MIMTATADDARPGQAAPAPAGGRAGTGRTEPADEVDVATLAGHEPPPEGLWLWATEVDGEPGGAFTGERLPIGAPRAFGGDVVLRLGPGPGRLPGLPTAHVQAYAVLAGTLVLVAEWGLDGLGDWPEVVRVTAAFTMGVLTDLEARGADLRTHEGVDLEAAAVTAAVGLPASVQSAPSPVP
jgi:hypothetical protein